MDGESIRLNWGFQSTGWNVLFAYGHTGLHSHSQSGKKIPRIPDYLIVVSILKILYQTGLQFTTQTFVRLMRNISMDVSIPPLRSAELENELSQHWVGFSGQAITLMQCNERKTRGAFSSRLRCGIHNLYITLQLKYQSIHESPLEGKGSSCCCCCYCRKRRFLQPRNVT